MDRKIKSKTQTVPLERGRKKKTFLYKQLADAIKSDIKAGGYMPGDRIMSMDDIAAKYKLNKITVCKALKELALEGVVYSLPAKGTFVAEPVSKTSKSNAGTGTIRKIGLMSLVMTPTNTGCYHRELLEVIRQKVGEKKCNLVILPAHTAKDDTQLLPMVKDSFLDAIIYIGPFNNQILRQLINQGPPAVMLDYSVTGINIDTICQDNAGGAYQAISYLLEQGLNNITVVKGEDFQQATKERLAGINCILEERDDIHIRFENGDFSEKAGYKLTLKILSKKKPPEAIFYMNDEMALGGMHAIYEKGLRIPDDISIIGYDDISLAGSSHINLSSIKAPTEEMGTLAVETLFNKLDNPDTKSKNQLIRLSTTLAIRQSVKKK